MPAVTIFSQIESTLKQKSIEAAQFRLIENMLSSKALLPLPESHGLDQGTHKEQCALQTWLHLNFLPQITKDAGYHDAVGQHFIELVSDQLTLGGFHWVK